MGVSSTRRAHLNTRSHIRILHTRLLEISINLQRRHIFDANPQIYSSGHFGLHRVDMFKNGHHACILYIPIGCWVPWRQVWVTIQPAQADQHRKTINNSRTLKTQEYTNTKLFMVSCTVTSFYFMLTEFERLCICLFSHFESCCSSAARGGSNGKMSTLLRVFTNYVLN